MTNLTASVTQRMTHSSANTHVQMTLMRGMIDSDLGAKMGCPVTGNDAVTAGMSTSETLGWMCLVE